MLTPDDLATAAEEIFASPPFEPAARARGLAITPLRAVHSHNWRILRHEVPPPLAIRPPLFGDAPEMPPRQIPQSRLWGARDVRLVGRRGLIGQDGALFAGGPIRSEADVARLIEQSKDGGEGLVLHRDGTTRASVLTPPSKGERRINGIGLHLGAAAGTRAAPFMLDQFVLMLLVAELRPKFDWVVLADAPAALPVLLHEMGLGTPKILNLVQMQGVVCSEILVPVVARDPAGWLDSATVRRFRDFARRLLVNLGSGIHPAPKRYFLTSEGGEHGPLAELAAEKGYEVRAIERRTLIDRALLMTQASVVATDCRAGVLTSLFAAADVPVLDFSEDDASENLPLLAGTGRPYALVSPDDAEEAFAQFGADDEEAA